MANDRDELMRLAERAPQNGAVPEGWRIWRDAKVSVISIIPPNGEGRAIAAAAGGLPGLLYALAEAMLAAAPAPEADEYADCCDTPAYCSSVRRCTAKDAAPEAERAKGEAGAQSLAEMCAAGRAHKGWTLRQAEAETGVSNALISQIETGKQDNPTLRVLSALTRAYGLNPSSVLGLIAHPTPPPAGQPEGVEALASEIADLEIDKRGRKTWSFDNHGLAEFARRLASAPQAVQTDGVDVLAIALAEEVRSALDRQACPDHYMRIAFEAIKSGVIRRLASAQQENDHA